jgi:hypothetical protein
MARKILLFLIFFVMAVSAVAVSDAYAKKSIWSILFPYIVKDKSDETAEDDVTKTKQAPFAFPESQKAPPSNGPLSELYEPLVDVEGLGGNTPMEKPHRHHEQIATWLLKGVSDIMTVNPDTYEDHLKDISSLLNESSLKQFDDFMKQSRTLETLAANHMRLTVFIESDPVLLNKAPLSGRYRWLFEMPVTLSLIPQGTNSYENVKPVNHRVILRVQVGRIPPVEGKDDIIIETFDITHNNETK